jgi:hypothetical protein
VSHQSPQVWGYEQNPVNDEQNQCDWCVGERHLDFKEGDGKEIKSK